MRLITAIKAFFKALKDPKKAQEFLDSAPPKKLEPQPQDFSHIKLLSSLQQTGRLIDFFKEDIANYNDEQIGSAVRKIHEDCNKILEELISIRPILKENEGSVVKIPLGYDPRHIKIIGNVKGEAPYSGIIVHKGWKAERRSLPKTAAQDSQDVLCPAQVEIR